MRASRLLFEQNPGAGARIVGLIDREQAQELSPRTGTLLKALARLYDGDAHRYINFYGPPGTVTTIPYHAVIRGGDPNLRRDALDFTNKVVFVGYSDLFDPGQPDRFYTVFTRSDGVDLSGVEIAATAYGNLATDQTLKPCGALAGSATLVVFGIVMGAIAYALPAIAGVPLALALALAYALAAQWLFNTNGVWQPLATPVLLQSSGALFIGLFGQYLLERRRGKRIGQAIGSYLPENIARELTENGLDPGAANRVVYATCLATDMAGFSTLAERLKPGELASFLNDYFETLAQPLKRHRADVTEFRADAIMCGWTAPEPDAAVRGKALLAALEIGEAVADFSQRHDGLGAKLRIGLDAGSVYVGHAGGGGHFVYSIVGDCANTASRVEGLNKHLGTRILATEAVVDGMENLLLRRLGNFRVVGKSEPISVVEVVATMNGASPNQHRLCKRFADALSTFQQARWDDAIARFRMIVEEYPDDGPARFYISVCEWSRSAPAPHSEDPRVIVMEGK